MTWAQLKTAVEAQLTTLKLPLTVQVAAIEWNAEEFGGPMPTVFVGETTQNGVPYVKINVD